MKLSNPLIVLDVETTGTWIEKDKIIEIALVRSFPNAPNEEYIKKVNPGIPIPPVVTQLTGITDQDVKHAPLFKDIALEVLQFIGDADLAGFNIERFDLPLIEREMVEAGQKFEWKRRRTYDAQKIYHLNEKRDLTAAYKFYCHKELNNAHSALADSRAVLDILKAQVEKYGDTDEGLESLGGFEYEIKQDFFSDERKFRWWNGKLYMMFGKYARQYNLQEIVKRDRAYLEWIISADFSDEVKTLVQNALGGKFPASQADQNKNKQGELFASPG